MAPLLTVRQRRKSKKLSVENVPTPFDVSSNERWRRLEVLSFVAKTGQRSIEKTTQAEGHILAQNCSCSASLLAFRVVRFDPLQGISNEFDLLDFFQSISHSRVFDLEQVVSIRAELGVNVEAWVVTQLLFVQLRRIHYTNDRF